MDTEAGEDAKNAGDGSPTAEQEDKEQGDGSSAAPHEAGGEESKEEEGGDVAKEKVEGEKRKRGRKRKAALDKSGEEGEGMPKERKRRSVVVREGATPVERPSRERKTVERFSEMSLPRSPVPKTLSFKQGSGEKLKDIPNVFFKLSKRKADDNLQALHGILFGRKANVHYLKRNILQFSGFVWSENEAKQRARFKEKLDKCKKERLLDFCDLLDIHAVKASSKKEEIIANLMEFLESPCVTRDVVLAEKEEKKRGRAKGRSHSTPGEASSDRRIKHLLMCRNKERATSNQLKTRTRIMKRVLQLTQRKHLVMAKVMGMHWKRVIVIWIMKKMRKMSKRSLKPLIKDEPNSTHGNKKGSSKEMNKQDSRASTEEKSAMRKNSAKVTKSALSSPRKSDPVDDSDSEPRSTTKSKQERGRKGRAIEKPPATKENTRKKRSAKSESKVTEKKRGKVKTSKVTNSEPSTEELHAVVSDILKEVDFNTATLADILRQLGARFKMNLMDRKAEVKRIIEDVINSMSDDEDGEDEDRAEDAKEDDTKEGSDDGDGDK
uniref:DEK-C domain-containing protein n=1 Tax=Musa acuminata subsp. malaccensis TaxID=214687 RepID=A0A804L5J3_MUSAM|nr:PREDICTED: protein DEK-like isoform X1 [Musa acuminata subsp. malaccensis]